MIRLIRPYISFDEVEQDLRKVFDSGMFTRGENVVGFADELATYTGARHAFLATSATTALWLCLKRLAVGPGDEVIVSDFSFPATANVVEDLGARPVFADVCPDTFNMTPEALKAKITEKTRAVIFVDALGNPSGITKIAEICRENALPLIEDAACALGSSEAGQRCGNIADMTCFSFHPRKLLTTGEGGAVTINNTDWVAWFNRKLSHGGEGMRGYGLDFVDYGYNFRMSETQAVMGRAQLKKLDDIIAERNEIRDAYIQQLASAGFTVQGHGPEVVHNVQSLVFRIPEGCDRDTLITRLREVGIETTLGTYALSATTYYHKRYNDVQPVASRLQDTTLTLPCYADLDVEYVCEQLVGLVTKRK
ncbi:DegT/DnrJ/EryC1/StrS aminotransferase family protein [Thalassobius sp. Cn5-15]|uniref:DegT/DnrJ/EryC1/StrS family aminotransferase n=1 Tax=Thalassobius sp. Cn5-15 TaxID=2917763 RepID=UPI001EF171E6|nr:DegT/DnrJ/EryC1/StrS family aminotransferase [Thalassobius sp. Cn5-15]MCG7495015.1 DegT/DnrJ/EryC1/StrS family aminotransferase [Thalassobius sp. Cn5-15]